MAIRQHKKGRVTGRETTRREVLRQAAALGLVGVPGIATLSGIGATSAKAQKANEVVVISGADISTLDPSQTNTFKDWTIIGCITNRLTRMSGTNYGQVEPLLATSWEPVKPDRWRLKLRQNVKFHNGTEFNAETAKWSLEHWAKKALFKGIFSALDRVDVVDRHTIDFVTKYPTALVPLFLNAAGDQLDPNWMTGSSFSPDKLVGTGPARLVEWVKGQHVVLEANPDYWGGRIPFDRFVTRAISEASTRANAGLVGEGDIVRNILGQDVPRFKGRKGVSIKRIGSNRCAHIRLRDDTPPFDNKLVRQALNYAVDIDSIVTNVLQGYGVPVQGQMQGRQARYWEKDVKAYPYDPQKAKALLAQAGYPNGFSTKLGTARGRDQGDFEFASAIAGQLRDIGVKAEVIAHEPGIYQGKYSGKGGQAEPLFYWSSGNIIPDAQNGFRDLLVKRGGFEVRAKELADIYERMQRAISDADRKRVAREGIDFIHDYAPVIFGYQLQQAYAVSDKVNWEPRSDEYIFVDEIKLA